MPLNNFRGELHVPANARPIENGVLILPAPDAEPGEWNPFDGRAEDAGFIRIGAMTE